MYTDSAVFGGGVMRRCLCMLVALVSTYSSSKGMLEYARTMEMSDIPGREFIAENSATVLFSVDKDRTVAQQSISPQMSDDVEGRLQSLLISLSTNTFGLNPDKGSVVDEDAIVGFNFVLWPQLSAMIECLFSDCSGEQQKKLIQGIIERTSFVIRNYLEFPKSFELYFDNVMEKLLAIANTLLIQTGGQPYRPCDIYKWVTLELIKYGKCLYDKSSADFDQTKKSEYDQNCKDRIVKLINLVSRGSLTLNRKECYEIIQCLNIDSIEKSSLLEDLYANGLSLMMNYYGIVTCPDLFGNIGMLQKITSEDIAAFKKDNKNVLYYMATLHCLSSLDNLHFSLGIYEAYDEEEVEQRQLMQTLAKEALDKILRD